MDRKLQEAQADYDATASILPKSLAYALFEPIEPAEHLAAIGAYCVWLEEVYGDRDVDWLHQS